MKCEIVTAGRTGTPDWQLDKLYEDECAAAWETENQPGIPLARIGFDALNKAWAALETARVSFDLISQQLAEAAECVADTPESDKLCELYDRLENLRTDTGAIRETLRTEKHRAFEQRRFAG